MQHIFIFYTVSLIRLVGYTDMTKSVLRVSTPHLFY